MNFRWSNEKPEFLLNIYSEMCYRQYLWCNDSTKRSRFFARKLFLIIIILGYIYSACAQHIENAPLMGGINAVLSPNVQSGRLNSIKNSRNDKQKKCEDENVAEGIAVDCVPINASTTVTTGDDNKAINLRQRIKRWKLRQRSTRIDRDAAIYIVESSTVPSTTTNFLLYDDLSVRGHHNKPGNHVYYRLPQLPYVDNPLVFHQQPYSGEPTEQSRQNVELHHHHNICEHNGTFINGKCHCFYPYTGARCADFVCEHGLSVGPRYDPDSTFFNRKCICDEDWAGELCNVPIADQCNERGQYLRGRCKCHGYYFGPKCQYVGKCVNGKLMEGICVCSYGYEGDYCDKIVCHHGYPDKSNDSNSCVCPPRHAGQFCDECVLAGLTDHLLPFPNCTVERIPHHARASRQRTDHRLIARLVIILVVLALLGLLLAMTFLAHWDRQRTARERNSNGAVNRRGVTVDGRDERGYSLLMRHRAMVEERKQMLERAILHNATVHAIVRGGRKPENSEASVVTWHSDDGRVDGHAKRMKTKNSAGVDDADCRIMIERRRNSNEEAVATRDNGNFIGGNNCLYLANGEKRK